MIKFLHSDFTKSKNKRMFEMLLCTNSSVKEHIYNMYVYIYKIKIFLNRFFLNEGAEVQRSSRELRVP